LNIHTIILAGGKGTRMLSQKAKVLQALGGRTMLNHVLTTANKISNKISVVVGFDKEGVEEEINEKLEKIYSNLDPWQTALVARHEDRPKAKFFVENLIIYLKFLY